ncbi:hypothetical protein GYMLUDRAFT_228676 [Collybiopsis luxurians FD-317 M1]|uniref:Uncharacterized protein n=1 Tax=Collybiopsis luxurians FD-317 M1 TaxID=944289 RepID=A0A0D0CQH0_9AGAR|nr:hypothetical protein GYMLUDRAFT_228676 [Collybiopsis luxurians FD-317 M1]
MPLTHRGFSAWIVVDGLPVPEYLTAVNNKSNQVSCWIPGEEGKTFSVHWSDAGGKVDTCSFITLDGVVVPGRFLLGSGATYRSGVRTSKSTEAPFVFKSTQENPSIIQGSPSSSSKLEAGMITLKIKRVTRTAPRPANPYQDLSKLSQSQQQFGELYAGFGAESKSYEQSPFTWAIHPHDENSSNSKKIATYVSFVFRYRTREFLQAQGIMDTEPVPNTPPPKPPLRVPVRRIVSAPAGAAPPTPSPTPPLRPHKEEKKPYIANPYPLRRPTVDTRRTASWRATTVSGDPSNFMYYGTQGLNSPDSGLSQDDSDSRYNVSL